MEYFMQEYTGDNLETPENELDSIPEVFEPEVIKEPWKKGVKFYIFFMGVSIVLLYVLNNLQYMGITQLGDNYISCLWAVNLCLGLSIMGNFVLLLYRPKWFHYLVQIIVFVSAIIAIAAFYKVFPIILVFSSVTTAVKISLGVLAAIALALPVNATIRYIKALFSNK